MFQVSMHVIYYLFSRFPRLHRQDMFHNIENKHYTSSFDHCGKQWCLHTILLYYSNLMCTGFPRTSGHSLGVKSTSAMLTGLLS
jgi:hypothetical protein